MNDLININVDYKYINDTENTVAFKTFRNSISSEKEYTNPSDNSQKLGNFKQTETALANTNTNFESVKTAVDTLESEVTALSSDVSTYLGQSQVFSVYATLQSAEISPTENIYIQKKPDITEDEADNLDQQPQEGSLLALRVNATNSITNNGSDAQCAVRLSYPDPDGVGYKQQLYPLGMAMGASGAFSYIPTYGIKAGKTYLFVLNSNGQFVNVESKISKRLTGTFTMLSPLQNVTLYGNSWATDGSMLYINLLLGNNSETVYSTQKVIATLNNAQFLSNFDMDTQGTNRWFPAMARKASSANEPLTYMRAKIKNNQLIVIAPGTSTVPSSLNYLMINATIPLPDNMGIF